MLLPHFIEEEDIMSTSGPYSSIQGAATRLNHSKSTSEDHRVVGRLEEAITNPGSVKINVKGAFIVDDHSDTSEEDESDGIHYEHKDIRLPHHTDVVSHIAVDVSLFNLTAMPRHPHNLTLALTNLITPQIGGSLAKLVYFSRELGSADNGGRLNFMNF